MKTFDPKYDTRFRHGLLWKDSNPPAAPKELKLKWALAAVIFSLTVSSVIAYGFAAESAEYKNKYHKSESHLKSVMNGDVVYDSASDTIHQGCKVVSQRLGQAELVASEPESESDSHESQFPERGYDGLFI